MVKPVDITQFPIFKTSGGGHGSLLILGINVDKNERLNLNCLVDSHVEVTYCPSDVIDILMGNNSMLLQKYFSLYEQLATSFGQTQRETDFDIIDFKPLWAIRKGVQRQVSRLAKGTDSFKQRNKTAAAGLRASERAQVAAPRRSMQLQISV